MPPDQADSLIRLLEQYGPASESTWLYRFAHDVALTHVHKNRRHTRPLDFGEGVLEALPAASLRSSV